MAYWFAKFKHYRESIPITKQTLADNFNSLSNQIKVRRRDYRRSSKGSSFPYDVRVVDSYVDSFCYLFSIIF